MPEFDVLVQDAYVVALEELVKYIGRERPDFDKTFLVEALEKQKEELQKLLDAAGGCIFPRFSGSPPSLMESTL